MEYKETLSELIDKITSAIAQGMEYRSLRADAQYARLVSQVRNHPRNREVLARFHKAVRP